MIYWLNRLLPFTYAAAENMAFPVVDRRDFIEIAICLPEGIFQSRKTQETLAFRGFLAPLSAKPPKVDILHCGRYVRFGGLEVDQQFVFGANAPLAESIGFSPFRIRPTYTPTR